MLPRILALLFAGLAYLAMLAVSVQMVAFFANWPVPRGIDLGPPATFAVAVTIDLALLLAFALQHSVMARPAVKSRLEAIIPPPVHRSVYVLASSLALSALFCFWHPLPWELWRIDNSLARAAVWAIFLFGWLLAGAASASIDHLGLFGLRQAWEYFSRRQPRPAAFTTPFLYRRVRHPLMLGTLIGVWATPEMTLGHLLLAMGFTAYILAALPLEEADLVREHGQSYRDYQRRVPLLIPWMRL